MATRHSRGAFDWSTTPKPTPYLLPNGYYLMAVESHELVHSSAGNLGVTLACRIIEPEESANQVSYQRFYVGHEADPDAEDPVTWSRANEAVGSRINVERLCKLLKACGLVGEDCNVHPLDLIEDGIDGCEFIAKAGTRTNKNGELEQTFDYFDKADRKPMLIATPQPTLPQARGATRPSPFPAAPAA